MLTMTNVTKAFGGVVATNDFSAHFTRGSLSAIIGPNGAGKTTLFNLISGKLKADAGSIVFDGKDITRLSPKAIVRCGIGRAFQVSSIFPTLTVAESLAAAVMAHQGQMGSLATSFATPRPTSSIKQRTAELLEMLGMESRAYTLARHLPHGDQKLLDIGLALALEPRLLLLDEPTAGMGPEERLLMMERVHHLWQRENITIIFIEHDMDIVFARAQTIRVLYYGALLAQGTPDYIRNHQGVIDAYLGTGFGEAEA
ncbi:ABC transporter ATP-binding protein [Glaciimonas immobilis]|uniref:Branched-chain amino acid transport system ATP-binding protein n=1 Tax=Glaciimonas immobilis TaxID=728004 RepID=A0A840RRP6_9BURK|nr:ABC transporter ATP-binding protein [Glaciimonas immobilis]KAF3996486.1 ABC transporter ATP-binding protein [Glaciimonas immobilis]MBB5201157.1 branched-chain amino acid transport system ATP-binding protein [Glaciimonas immobilis]